MWVLAGLAALQGAGMCGGSEVKILCMSCVQQHSLSELPLSTEDLEQGAGSQCSFHTASWNMKTLQAVLFKLWLWQELKQSKSALFCLLLPSL